MARHRKEPETVEHTEQTIIQPVFVETNAPAKATRLTTVTQINAVSRETTKTVRDKKNGNTRVMAAAFADALVRSDRINFEIV